MIGHWPAAGEDFSCLPVRDARSHTAWCVLKECKLPRVEISCTQAVVVKIIIAKKVMSKDHVYAAEEYKKNFISCVGGGKGG